MDLTKLGLYINAVSSFTILLLSIVALIYIQFSGKRVKTYKNTLILVSGILSSASKAADHFLTVFLADKECRKLKIMDYCDAGKFDDALFIFEFIFGWLSLTLFVLEYLSTEQEVRKVLAMEYTEKKRRKYEIVAVVLLILTPFILILIWHTAEIGLYKYHLRALSGVIASGALFVL